MTIPAFIFTALLHLFPACPTEDSKLCAWDAKAQGNGIGQSFIAISDNLILRSAS